MNHLSWICLITGLTFFAGCAQDSEHRERGGEHGRRAAAGEHGSEKGRGEHGSREGRGEHDREEKEHGGEHGREGEESGTRYAKTATCTETRHGAQLDLRFDATAGAFVGTVRNTTEKPLPRVRVEVHLSNGKELGPTPAGSLAAGASREIRLPTTSSFDTWSAHAEVGSAEHSGK